MTNSYPERGRASPHSSQVYDHFLSQLGLSTADHSHLLKRGLSSEQIKAARYATKKSNKSNDTIAALASTDRAYDLNEVPGFWLDERGHRKCSGLAGIFIPVRDIDGNIGSILNRRMEAAVDKNGLALPKYQYFSSSGKSSGNKVKSTTHCPTVKGPAREVCGDTAILTEGILKADVATALGDTYCLGMNGLAYSRDLITVINELEIQKIQIAFDAGEETNEDYIIKLAALVLMLQEHVEVEVLRWDKAIGKGIDDVLKNGKWDDVWVADEEQVNNILARANKISPRGKAWVYCIKAKAFFNTETWLDLDKSQYADKFKMGTTKNVNDMLQNGFPDIDDLTYLPGGELHIEEEGISYLNLWKDPKIKPIEGDGSIFIDHIKYLFPDERDRKIFMNWFACNIQQPEVKIMYAVLIIGAQGIGKSFLAQVASLCLGKGNVAKPYSEEIHENFTGWMKGASLGIIEEVMYKDKFELMNKLKPIITQPELRIREMRREAYSLPNRLNLLMFTNHDDALSLENDDRRYAILKSDAKKKEHSYYKKLFAWLKEPETAGKLLNYFLNYDLSDFEPEANAPMTDAKEDMIASSRTGLEEWVSNCINDECWPFNGDIVAIRYLKNRNVCPNGYEKWSDKKWAKTLYNVGAVPLDINLRLSDKSRVRVWAVRRQKFWQQQDSEDIKRHFESSSLEVEPGYNPTLDNKPI